MIIIHQGRKYRYLGYGNVYEYPRIIAGEIADEETRKIVKDLMAAIKARLQADTTLNYVRDADIYITEDEMLIPATTRFPAIAIKDGAISNAWETNRRYIQNARVRITGYVGIKKAEESIMGSDAENGLLDLIQHVFNSLTNYRALLTGIDEAFPVDEEPSQMYGDEKEMIQRKTITFQYKRQKTLPNA